MLKVSKDSRLIGTQLRLERYGEGVVVYALILAEFPEIVKKVRFLPTLLEETEQR